jgi:hypothetical protein
VQRDTKTGEFVVTGVQASAAQGQSQYCLPSCEVQVNDKVRVIDEGALSFVTTMCYSYRDSPYKRE